MQRAPGPGGPTPKATRAGDSASEPERPGGRPRAGSNVGAVGADGRGRHVVLVGAMGVGKTTVGRRLARELQRPFADADEQLELRAGRTIPAIFRDDGEEAFRRLQSAALADLRGAAHPLVVAAGGGAVTRPENRALLGRRAFVVWLRASPAFLSARADPTHRPLLAGDPDVTATPERLIAARPPLYEGGAAPPVDGESSPAGDEKPKRALPRHIARLVGVPAE